MVARAINRFSNWLNVAATVWLMVIAIVIFLEVTGRGFFNIQAYAGKVAKVHETLEAIEMGLLDIGGWCVCLEGAIPVTTTLPTAYNALATGVASGFIMFPGVYFGFKFHEPAPHFKVTNFGAMAQTISTINLKTMKKLPKDVLKIIMEEMASYETATNLDAYGSEAIGLKKLKAAGAKISTLPVDQQRAWAVALKNWPNERANDMAKYGIDGVAVMKKYMKYIEEAGHKWPFRYVFSKR